MINKHKGSTFDSFLLEENLLEEADVTAIKRVIAYQLEQAMKKSHISKSELAIRMHTSRSALERLFDPSNTSITLHTLIKAAHALGKKLHVSFA